MSRRPLAASRDGWLGSLAEFTAMEGDDCAVTLWDVLCAMLTDEDGMDPRKASEVALRCTKLGGRLLRGEEQRAAALALGVSERTGKTDAQRLRRIVESGALRFPAGRLPTPPGDPARVRTGRRPA